MTRSAPWALASSRPRRILATLPSTSPTTGFCWASAMFSVLVMPCRITEGAAKDQCAGRSPRPPSARMLASSPPCLRVEPMPEAALTKKIAKAVDDGFDEQIKFTADLTRLPSLRGQEATAQDFMARAYRDRGLAVDRWKIDVDDIKSLPGFSPVAVSYD